MSRPHVSISGQRYGRLTVGAFVRRENGAFIYACRCDCGSTVEACARTMVKGRRRSCGCLKRETAADHAATLRRSHGQTGTFEHRVWKGMRTRCSNPNATGYEYWGGRGIRVCERWDDFALFLADMEPAPSTKHTIEREDNDGHYEPSNCRWATRTEQARNTRRWIRKED